MGVTSSGETLVGGEEAVLRRRENGDVHCAPQNRAGVEQERVEGAATTRV